MDEPSKEEANQKRIDKLCEKNYDAGRASREPQIIEERAVCDTAIRAKDAEIARLKDALARAEGKADFLNRADALLNKREDEEKRVKALEAVAEAAQSEYDEECECQLCIKLRALDALDSQDKGAKKK